MALIKVCDICLDSRCDGQEYETEEMYGMGISLGKKIVCSSQLEIVNGELMYKLTIGHGMTNYYKATKKGETV